ncbi:MAG: cyclic nucleotide-binding domain-containing protein [Actinobacteria bacterium]|nr:MAG: cyclic nucleotide-binding domain-containing protein [Actinomycetota bacterium]TML21129.1 MAG: cyclic nucleotide-binding domain-containing protein [Actinomycetota bacterium]
MERRVTHSLVSALRDVPGFESVDERVLLALIGESANLYWLAGSTVFRRATPADGLYIVISGSVRVVGEDGVTRATLGAGDFFGEMSLLLDTTHHQDVVVDEDAELMVIPKEKFDELMASHEDVRRHVRAKAKERAAAGASPAMR